MTSPEIQTSRPAQNLNDTVKLSKGTYTLIDFSTTCEKIVHVAIVGAVVKVCIPSFRSRVSLTKRSHKSTERLWFGIIYGDLSLVKT